VNVSPRRGVRRGVSVECPSSFTQLRSLNGEASGGAVTQARLKSNLRNDGEKILERKLQISKDE